MKILVVTSVFPNSKQPTLGVFIKERMFKVARHCELKVLAPVPWFPFVNFIKNDYRPRIPYKEILDGIEVFHPRFFNFPGIFKSLDGLFFFLSSVFSVWRIKKEFDFDIIDAHFAYPDGMGAVLIGKFFHKPVVITVRGTLNKLSRFFFRRLQIIYALKSANRVFTVCQDLKDKVVSLGIEGHKVVVIPNGVDISKFKIIEKDKARHMLNLPLDKKIIISVGGLVKRKGFHHLIKAIYKLINEIPEIFLVIVGGQSVEGDYRPELEKLVRRLSLERYVYFAGPQPHEELYKWLSAADVFSLVTSNEGWANVFLEAMACGLPVVTTDVGGNPEVIINDDLGFLIKLGDEEQLTKAIADALGKRWDRERIISYAKRNSWDSVARRIIEEMRSILKPDLTETRVLRTIR
jgi:glycosyltransferase involved in cell wall biosynthesis